MSDSNFQNKIIHEDQDGSQLIEEDDESPSHSPK
jgi:hypothetical protein